MAALPKDMLSERVTIATAPKFEQVETSPGEEEMAALRDLLADAKRPLFVLGGSRWSEAARRQIHEFAERTGESRAPLRPSIEAKTSDLLLARLCGRARRSG